MPAWISKIAKSEAGIFQTPPVTLELLTSGRDANLMLAREPGGVCPSHGDFHPMNVFVSRDRVTAIDLDTLASRDREMDIGYFLAQTAIFGVHLFGSFGETSNLRNEFLRHCGPLDRHRAVAHMAAAILQSLHYDLCILRVRNESFDARPAPRDVCWRADRRILRNDDPRENTAVL